MQVTCQRDALLAACQIVGAAVAARTTKPILSNVKAITADDGTMTDGLTLMATDLEVGIRYELRGVKVTRPGAAILPVARLVSILRETADPEITVAVGPETTTIKLSTGRFELPSADPAEFPEIPGFPAGSASDEGYHEITASTLRTMIRRTAFAVEKRESTRFAVTGVLWEVDDGPPAADGGTNPVFQGKCRLVATDTRRLALCEGAATVADVGRDVAEGAAKATHLIPLKAIHLLERNLVDDGELVRVVLRPNEALFQTERALIHTRLVEGRFPPYRNIIPGGWGKSASVPGKGPLVRVPVAVSEFLARVRQAAIMADDDSRRVDFKFAGGGVTMSARGAETGSGEVTMELPGYSGPDLDIAFEPTYLTDMLRAIEGEPTATLEMTDGQRPAVFRVGDGYLYLVMPLAG